MYDSSTQSAVGGSSASGGLPIRRRFRKSSSLLCAPTYGVSHGFVADIERPLPEGIASQRRTRRIPTSFHLRVGEGWVRVPGDLSSGGALVLFGQQLEGEVELVAELADGSQRWRARGPVLSVEMRGNRFAHHVRFNNGPQLASLEAEIARALDAGETRLATA